NADKAARLVAPGGRLLVVDFAPHDLEFLRESQAHRRLGFAADQVSGWLSEAGLDTVVTRDLAPTEQAQLTVTLWLAADGRVAPEAIQPERAVA
ncbi:ArsR family transcriptional regulator, partial [Methylobacterium sp. WL116]